VPAGELVVAGAVVEVVDDDFFRVDVDKVDVARVEVVLTAVVEVAATPETCLAPQMPALP